MDPSFRPPLHQPNLAPNEIRIPLPKFLEASENNQCSFCTILRDIFLGYVENAEEKVSRMARLQTRANPFTDPTASVFIASDKPVEIHFREGIGAKEVKYPPILLYGPAGNLVPFSYPSIILM